MNADRHAHTPSRRNHSFRDAWIVETTTGPVKGHAETGVVAFRGIPYAQPPRGDLRFRRARPVEPWIEPLIANHPGDYCAQYRNKSVGWVGSEDCLWLNIVVPNTAARSDQRQSHMINRDARRPIVVYFHGGSNVHGSANEPLLTGQYFAQAMDAVVVAVNYRVGIVGQLSLNYSAGTGAVGTESATRADSNPGLSDLVMAIRWVHDNVEAFGGDPARITIMGESSGGAMVTALTVVPELRGIIAGAIAQSPPVAMVHSPAAAGRWADRARAENPDLNDISAMQLAHLTERLNVINDDYLEFSGPFAPTVDGDLMTRHPLAVPQPTSRDERSNERSNEPDEEGREKSRDDGTPAANIPLLIGTNADEYVVMRWERMSTRAQRARIRRFAQSIGGRAPDILAEYYRGGRTRAECGRFAGDALFLASSLQLASRWPQGKAWMYRLDLTTPSLRLSGLGATHALDLPLLFERYDSGKGPDALYLGGYDQMRATSVVMQTRWKNFIHCGNPGFRPLSDRFATQIFNAGENTVEDPSGELRRAWADVDLTN
ncbi:carboxylesterase family protein [uncultured Corynebacterium sp.]|uniref:carboxylesterase/lipase family protein n=1 Tax=uncultured Corynebacterium sp. TaxID=159447 RepID=UPI0025FDD2E9|nr:carboxylesterase family protein [uncultured Corynebacterium sp.]